MKKTKIPRVNSLVKFDFEGFFKELKGASPKDIKRWKADFEKKFKSMDLNRKKISNSTELF